MKVKDALERLNQRPLVFADRTDREAVMMIGLYLRLVKSARRRNWGEDAQAKYFHQLQECNLQELQRRAGV